MEKINVLNSRREILELLIVSNILLVNFELFDYSESIKIFFFESANCVPFIEKAKLFCTLFQTRSSRFDVTLRII